MLLTSDSDSGENLDPRHERTIRRFYLRLLLGAYLGVSGKDVKISRLVRGKPVLNSNAHPQKLDFSSAGSNGCCLIGISTDGQIGVDLEMSGRRTAKPMSLVRRYFSETEQREFAQLDLHEINDAFLHTWACKEAVVKAAGHGIANQLCKFTVNINPGEDAAILEMDDDKAAEWKLNMVKPADEHIACVALRNPVMKYEGFNLSR